MAITLTKHPNESRLYYFEFSTYSGPLNGRDTVFGVPGAGAFSPGELFAPAMLLPLLFMMVNGPALPTINVARSDGAPNDLTVGTPFFIAGNTSRVGVRLSAGTNGLVYTITLSANTSQGNTVDVQGNLNVSNTLP